MQLTRVLASTRAGVGEHHIVFSVRVVDRESAAVEGLLDDEHGFLNGGVELVVVGPVEEKGELVDVGNVGVEILDVDWCVGPCCVWEVLSVAGLGQARPLARG